jgi:hypothetical protein
MFMRSHRFMICTRQEGETLTLPGIAQGLPIRQSSAQSRKLCGTKITFRLRALLLENGFLKDMSPMLGTEAADKSRKWRKGATMTSLRE